MTAKIQNIETALASEVKKRGQTIEDLKKSLKKDIEGPINTKIQNLQTALKKDKEERTKAIAELKTKEIDSLQQKILAIGREEAQTNKEIVELKKIILGLRDQL